MKINLLCVFCCPESLFFFPPPVEFSELPAAWRSPGLSYRVSRWSFWLSWWVRSLPWCNHFSWYEERVSCAEGYSFLYCDVWNFNISGFSIPVQFVERRKIALIRCIEHYVAAIVVLRRSLEFRGTVWLKELFAQFVLPFALLAAHRAIAVSHQRQKQQHRDPGADFVARGRSTACINGDEHCQTAC